VVMGITAKKVRATYLTALKERRENLSREWGGGTPFKSKKRESRTSPSLSGKKRKNIPGQPSGAFQFLPCKEGGRGRPETLLAEGGERPANRPERRERFSQCSVAKGGGQKPKKVNASRVHF